MHSESVTLDELVRLGALSSYGADLGRFGCLLEILTRDPVNFARPLRRVSIIKRVQWLRSGLTVYNSGKRYTRYAQNTRSL